MHAWNLFAKYILIAVPTKDMYYSHCCMHVLTVVTNSPPGNLLETKITASNQGPQTGREGALSIS